MAAPCTKAVPAPCAPAVADPRVLDNFTRRFNTATNQALVPSAAHPTNNDITFADECGTYSKGIKQASPGKVDLAAFAKFKAAIASGQFTDFEAIPLGGSAGKLNGPMGAYAKAFLGADSSLFGAPTVAAPPSITSAEYATELVELYWCSLLRDVAFTDYATNSTAMAAVKELSNAPGYQGPVNGSGKVTPELLFRGGLPGEIVGRTFFFPTSAHTYQPRSSAVRSEIYYLSGGRRLYDRRELLVPSATGHSHRLHESKGFNTPLPARWPRLGCLDACRRAVPGLFHCVPCAGVLGYQPIQAALIMRP